MEAINKLKSDLEILKAQTTLTATAIVQKWYNVHQIL